MSITDNFISELTFATMTQVFGEMEKRHEDRTERSSSVVFTTIEVGMRLMAAGCNMYGEAIASDRDTIDKLQVKLKLMNEAIGDLKALVKDQHERVNSNR